MSGKRKSQTLYRIGEAARLLALKTCVLRFWEGEFSQLAPIRTPKGQRLYTEQDMAVLRRIRSLLHEQGMTIEGARRVLSGQMTAPAEGARRVLSGQMTAPAEGARRVLSGQMTAPAEGVERRTRPLRARRDAPGQALEQGSLVGDGGEAGEGAANPKRDALLAETLAELESLRGLLRAAPAPSDSPSGPPSAQTSPSRVFPSQGRPV